MPTVLEMLKTGDPKNSQGTSLVKMLRGREEKQRDPSIWKACTEGRPSNWAPLTAWISGSLKYISLPQGELYDLKADPVERDNLFLKQEPSGPRCWIRSWPGL